MKTHFITAEIDLPETPQKMPELIEQELQKQGQPLRWAITQVDTQRQKVQIEAIVTVSDAVASW
ncbi:MAG: hypothetical protein ABI417_21850 [Coleofasciculaceae cyanobacterium]